MVATQTDLRAWQLGFQTLEREFTEEVELEIEGALPPDLAGCLYRVTPARFDVYGERYRHWFDGDGMVHALRVDRGRVFYRNRFVATAKKLREDRAGRRLFAVTGTPSAGNAAQRPFRAFPPRSPANTNIVFHGGRLLAMWEGARPYQIDPTSLATIGEEDFGGLLGPFDAFSAHPHYDPTTGEMWNFGSNPLTPRPTITIYRGAPDGVVEKRAKLRMPHPAWVHDFAITRTKVVVIVPPLVSPRLPVALYAGQKSFMEGLRWRPELGTRIAVVDRTNGDSRWYRCDPLWMIHTINAFDDGDDVVVDICASENASVMSAVTEAMVGKLSTLPAPPFPERLHLRANGRVDRCRLSDFPFEYPRLAGTALTREPSRIYGCTFLGGVFDNVPAALDPSTGAVDFAPVGENEVGSEPIAASRPGASSETDAWLLSVFINGRTQRSELRVYDAAAPSAGAVATAHLPHVVPLHFHGTWVSARQFDQQGVGV
jgi:all-trans-8'-apo-beta-carotenal 15,15'-oxygenase